MTVALRNARDSPNCDCRSRRAVLGSITALAAPTLAGCSGLGTSTSQTTQSSDDPIETLEYDGLELVVHLRDAPPVERVSLIAPDGTTFADRSVAPGATTVRLPILVIESGGQSRHYTPGTHDLVAVGGDTEYSQSVIMQPALHVDDVAQYDGDAGRDSGRLAVTIRNDGTAPTWVYGIGYEDAPNFAANGAPGSDPGTLLLAHPTVTTALVIQPGDIQRFVGVGTPVLFDDAARSQCEAEQFQFSVLIGAPHRDPIRLPLTVTAAGEPVTAGSVGQYTCSDLQVERRDDGGAS